MIESVLEANIVKLKNGRATLHFDPNGTINRISVEYDAYQGGARKNLQSELSTALKEKDVSIKTQKPNRQG